jgi:L-glutamine-phosphate cytidylyltransferase
MCILKQNQKTIAVLLSAGSGIRLGALCNDKPKCLLTLVNDDTVLDIQLRHLIAAGIKDIVISAGFKVEMIEEHIKRYSKLCDIQLIYNPFYDVSNNLVSLWNVRYAIQGKPFMIINGDNLFEKDVLLKAIENSYEACLLTNTKDHYDDDDMKVSLIDGVIKAVSKTITHNEANAESIGIMRFNDVTGRILIDKLESMVRKKEYLSKYYLMAIQNIIEDGSDIYSVDITGRAWKEIDYLEDYEKALLEYKTFLK